MQLHTIMINLDTVDNLKQKQSKEKRLNHLGPPDKKPPATTWNHWHCLWFISTSYRWNSLEHSNLPIGQMDLSQNTTIAPRAVPMENDGKPSYTEELRCQGRPSNRARCGLDAPGWSMINC